MDGNVVPPLFESRCINAVVDLVYVIYWLCAACRVVAVVCYTRVDIASKSVRVSCSFLPLVGLIFVCAYCI